MMLIVAVIVWLILMLFVVVLCRGAASADHEGNAFAGRHPASSTSSTARSPVDVGMVPTAFVLSDRRHISARAG